MKFKHSRISLFYILRGWQKKRAKNLLIENGFTNGKIIKATKENNNLEFKLVPLENSKSKDFGSGALINGLKC